MNTINKIASDVMVSSGFAFKRGAWYALSPDFIHVVYFQRSMYSDLYYLNLAVGFNPEHWGSFPKDYKFPAYYTLGAHARVKDGDELLSISNLTKEKETQICSLLRESLILFSPFFTETAFKEDYIRCRNLEDKYLFKGFWLYDSFLKQLQL